MGHILMLIFVGMISTVGFAMLFHVKAAHIPFAAIGGALSSAIYIILDDFGISLFLSNFIASLVSVVYSGVMARVLKTPTTIFVSLCIIPLVPGGSLFYTMRNLIMWNQAEFFRYGLNTILIALGIAGGIVVESAIVHLMGRAIAKARRQQAPPQEIQEKTGLSH